MSTRRYPSEPANTPDQPAHEAPGFEAAVHAAMKNPTVGAYFPPNTIPLPAIRGAAWGCLDYATVAADQTITASGTETALTGLTVTVNVGVDRRIRISGLGLISRTVADGITIGRFKEGTTELGRWAQHSPSGAGEFDNAYGAVILPQTGGRPPARGLHTYHMTLQRFSGTGNVSLAASATNPSHICVEDLGPVTEI